MASWNTMCVYVLFCVVFISASVPLPDERNDTIELQNQRRLINTLETITNHLKMTLDKEPMYSFQLASEILVADSNSLETEKAFLFCRPGSVLRGRMCGKTLTCNQKYLVHIGLNDTGRAVYNYNGILKWNICFAVVVKLLLLFCFKGLTNHCWLGQENYFKEELKYQFYP